LGKGLEADRERDFADAKIDIVQKIARLLDPCVRDVIDKVYSSYFFEFFAQVIGTDVDGLGDLVERKLFVRMVADKISRFPNFNRFCPIMIC